MKRQVNLEIMDFVEKQILPKYNAFGESHGLQTLSDSRSHHLHKGYRGTGIDGKFDRNAQEMRHTRIMFTEEDKHRLVKHMNIAEARLLSTFTFVMQDISSSNPTFSKASRRII